ncbi:venom dipeptidyl peptidase 4 [Apis florea]|uniref:venom dipeptidyl peptidase 4 n=1 Tax=Apis florea TaxID=7463 RepID=UPI0012FF2903|nr:venom dipeptidyl peptidase 4 [Apis florea]
MPWNRVRVLVQLVLVVHGSLLVLVAGKSIPRVIDQDLERYEPLEQEDHQGARVPFNLEETYDQSFRPNNFNGSWKTDREILYSDNYVGDIRLFDVTSGISTVLLDSSVTADFDKATVMFSFDNSHVAIGHDYVNAFRYSIYQKCTVYNIKSRTFTDIANGDRIPLFKWSPTRNALIYVHKNDIYYQVFLEGGSHVRRITNTGVPDVVFNGIPDWVYEEEVLASPVAFWVSPDGQHLAFATFNDTGVHDVVISRYGPPGNLKYQYPEEVKIKYPKAGTTNPLVSLSMIDLHDPSSKSIDLGPPVDVVGADNVLYTANWRRDGEFVATWTNRVQNKAEIVVYDTKGNANNIYYEEETEGWLRIQPPLYHNQYVIIVKLQDSGTKAGRFLHATRFEYKNGVLRGETDLTPGTREVVSLLLVDHARSTLYYLGTELDKPSHKNLYSVQLAGDEPPICLSCQLLTPEGNHCTYAYAYFSVNGSHYALYCAGPDPVFVTIMNANHRQIFIWEENRSLRRKLAGRARPILKNLNVNANGYTSKVKLYLPPDFDEKKRYPLLINVYAGPNTVRITEEATFGFEAYMVTNRSVIYGRIDGRGSAYKGSKMLFEIYRRLGTVEIEDQIAVTRTLQQRYSWIDSNRTGIWGWSYGGFSTAMVLATDTESVFKCGISVAPVTSWIYYDSLYTERFMGLPTPEDNLSGYNATDVSRRVEGIRGKRYMLIHGTADDNVHYQQSMALNKALVNSDIMFQQQTYTDEAHALGNVFPHLYHTMDRFWANCLGYSVGYH